MVNIVSCLQKSISFRGDMMLKENSYINLSLVYLETNYHLSLYSRFSV